MKQNVIVIIPAAGSGRRFGAEINKAFYPVLGKPVVLWALEAFQRDPAVLEIVPVFSESDLDRGMTLLEEHGITKARKVAPGGRERQDSVHNAIKRMGRTGAAIAIHDGARPIVDEGILARCVRALKDADGAVAAVPVKDTIKEVRGTVVRRTMDRGSLAAIQTPQVFRYETLVSAYERIIGKAVTFTDDAAVVEAAGGRVVTVEGSYRNIKITTPEDIIVAEAYLRARELREKA